MKRIARKFISLIVSLSMVIVMMPLTSVQGSDVVEINSTNFPDPAFREFIENEDDNSDGFLSSNEIESIRSLEFIDHTISSLKGIEYLTDLMHLEVNSQNIVELDLSKNTKLTSIYASNVGREIYLNGSTTYNMNGLVSDTSKVTIATNSDFTFSTTPGDIELKFPNLYEDYKVSYSYNTGNTTFSDISITLNFIGDEKPAVAIDDLNFPDDAFREYINLSLDNDNNGELSESEIEAATKIVLYNNKNILSVEGIEHFTNLEILSLAETGISKLDVSSLNKLNNLSIYNTAVSELDVSNNLALNTLNAGYTKLTKLNVSSNDKLENLSMDKTDISEIDVTSNSNLKTLSAIDTQISELNLKSNAALDLLSIDGTNIKEIDLTSNPNLKSLSISDTEIRTIDVTSNSELNWFIVHNTPISELNLDSNSKLELLDINFTPISKLNLESQTELSRLLVNETKITELDLSKNTKLIAVVAINTDYEALIKGSKFDLGTIVSDLSRVTVPESSSYTYENGIITFNDIYNIPRITYTYNTKNSNFPTWSVNLLIKSSEVGLPVLEVEDFEKTYDAEMVTVDDIEKSATINGKEIDGEWSFKNGETFKNAIMTTTTDIVFTPNDSSYIETEMPVDITIDKADLRITAKSVEIEVGQEMPTLEIIYSGFVGEETAEMIIETAPVIETFPDVLVEGAYPITFAKEAVLNGDNYNPIYIEGMFYVSEDEGYDDDDDDDDDDASSGGGSGSSDDDDEVEYNDNVDVEEPDTEDGKTTVKVAVEGYTIGGTTRATVEEDDLENIIESALEKAEEDNASPIVEIEVETEDNTEKVRLNLPKSALKELADEDDGALKVTSEVGELVIDQLALEAITQGGGSNVEIEIAKVDKEDLTDDQQEVVGNNEVIELSITSGGAAVKDFEGGKVQVSIPYELKAGENPEEIVVYYVAENGELEKLEAMYDEETETLIFITTHFSLFMVAFTELEETVEEEEGQMEFVDVSMFDWFYDGVMYVYSEGLMMGITENEFDPNGTATRAMVVTVLYRLAGEPMFDDILMYANFADVQQMSWYEKAVGWAAKEGVASGVGEGFFEPEKAITREELVTMIYRFMGEPELTAGQLFYSDVEELSTWAFDAMVWATTEGIISGKGNDILDPKGTATRAEIATVLMNLNNAH